MKPEPVKRARAPRYPTRLDAIADPTLLEAAAPPAWLRTAGIGGALGAILAWGPGGCSGPARPAAPGAAGGRTVAPIFEHGEGRGATGCVVVVPPVFLSEEEALQIIREELSYAGVELAPRGVKVPLEAPRAGNVRVAGVDLEGAASFVPGQALRSDATVETDLCDMGGKILVEFVSADDYDQRLALEASSVRQYRIKEVAADLAGRARLGGSHRWLGTFYDPVSYDHGRDYERASDRMRESEDEQDAEQARASIRRTALDLAAA